MCVCVILTIMQIRTWHKLISVGWYICTTVEKYVWKGSESGMIKKKTMGLNFLKKLQALP